MAKKKETRGRPSKPENRHLVQISVNITKQERDALNSLVEAIRTSRSNLGREAIVKILVNHGILIDNSEEKNG